MNGLGLGFRRIGQYFAEIWNRGAKKKKIETLRKWPLKLSIMFVIVLHSLRKLNVLYIYGRKFTKYFHGT